MDNKETLDEGCCKSHFSQGSEGSCKTCLIPEEKAKEVSK